MKENTVEHQGHFSSEDDCHTESEGQQIFLLSTAPFCPPTVQLVCIGLHRIHLHSLMLTFAIVVHRRSVCLVLGV